MLTFTIRLLRCLGWGVLLGSVGVVAGVILVETVSGPPAGQAIWPTPRLWRCTLNTLEMAFAATCLAMMLALPVTFGLVQARRPWQKITLRALAICPLVIPPSVLAYASMLVGTSRNDWIAAMVQACGWNTPGAEHWQAGCVLAMWLWPIPALILATSFSHVGARAYRLACLDASPVRAFCLGALPVMRAHLMAAAAVVFILAATESTVPPLMLASETWATEMVAAASLAGREARPVAYLAWLSWPLLATVAAAALAALPGLRQMSQWADESATDEPTSTAASSGAVWWVACLVAGSITAFPIVVFSMEFGTGSPELTTAVATAYKVFRSAGLASLVVAGLAAAASLLPALAALNSPDAPRAARLAGGVMVSAALIVAVLPPEIIGVSLVSVFSHPAISPPERWNIYDDSPVVWAAAMVARFGFLPICVAWLINRRVPTDLVAQARSDGANRFQCLVHTCLALLWRPLLASGMMVGCLTLSESAASVLVRPPRFFAGSLAVQVDMQMHYGRQSETTVLSLMLMIPAILAAVAFPVMSRLGALRQRGRKPL